MKCNICRKEIEIGEEYMELVCEGCDEVVEIVCLECWEKYFSKRYKLEERW